MMQSNKNVVQHTVHAHPERKDLEQQAAQGLKSQIPAAGGTKPEVGGDPLDQLSTEMLSHHSSRRQGCVMRAAWGQFCYESRMGVGRVLRTGVRRYLDCSSRALSSPFPFCSNSRKRLCNYRHMTSALHTVSASYI
jgi:hypothetical protein